MHNFLRGITNHTYAISLVCAYGWDDETIGDGLGLRFSEINASGFEQFANKKIIAAYDLIAFGHRFVKLLRQNEYDLLLIYCGDTLVVSATVAKEAHEVYWETKNQEAYEALLVVTRLIDYRYAVAFEKIRKQAMLPP